nr:aldo/keto reductase [Nanchangia anserum]
MREGGSIPQFGIGTYQVAPAETVATVRSALEIGIRHIDTAQMYGNEAEVGRAIAESGIARDDMFLTTKLNNGNHAPDDARRSFERSLRDLRTDYVDLFLIHWPLPTRYGGDFVTTWRVLTEFAADGRARHIGVSNFQIPHLRRLIDEVGVVPEINQIEAHPYLPNNDVRDFGAGHGILTQAWSPLARGAILDDPQVRALAEDLGRTPAQVVLRWAIERGDVIFPKSVHPERQLENLSIFDFSLPPTAREVLDGLDRGEAGRQGSHPDTMDLITR